MAKKTAAKTTTPATTKLERHELSIYFGLPTNDDERLALGTHMERHGQQHEILLYEDKVLDGWERYMACLQKGITPKFRKYEGDDPASIAFGMNMVRRKLSAVQKAVFAAKFYIHCTKAGKPVKQADVAKMSSVGLTRLSQMIKLYEADTSQSKRCIETLETNPDVTWSAVQSMLLDCKLVEPVQNKVTLNPSAVTISGDDEDDDDITGGAISALLGGDDLDPDDLDPEDSDEDGDDVTTTSAGAKVKRTAIGGDGDLELPERGSKRSNKDHRSKETPASVIARSFRSLTEPERLDFVKFAWPTLRPALEKTIAEGRIEWEFANAKKDPGAAALGDLAAAVTPKSAQKANRFPVAAQREAEAAIKRAASKAKKAPAPVASKKTTPASAKPAKGAKPAQGKPAPTAAKRSRKPAPTA